MVTKSKIAPQLSPTVEPVASRAPSLHLIDVKVGFLPPWDNARYIYFPIGKGKGYKKKLGKVQRTILEMLGKRPYTLSGLDLALNKGIGNTWNHLLSLNRRGLLAHVFLTDVNLFGCRVKYRYYALAKHAGDGSLASRLELAIRCLEVAEGDRIQGQRRSLDTYKAMADHAAALKAHPVKAAALRRRALQLERDFYTLHPQLLFSETTPTKMIPARY